MMIVVRESRLQYRSYVWTHLWMKCECLSELGFRPTLAVPVSSSSWFPFLNIPFLFCISFFIRIPCLAREWHCVSLCVPSVVFLSLPSLSGTFSPLHTISLTFGPFRSIHNPPWSKVCATTILSPSGVVGLQYDYWKNIHLSTHCPSGPVSLPMISPYNVS